MNQFTTLTVKQAFSMKSEGSRGRAVQAKIGDRFVVTSPSYDNKETAKIAREKGSMLNVGYLFPVSLIETYFEVEA
jgi:hypothetical protein